MQGFLRRLRVRPYREDGSPESDEHNELVERLEAYLSDAGLVLLSAAWRSDGCVVIETLAPHNLNKATLVASCPASLWQMVERAIEQTAPTTEAEWELCRRYVAGERGLN